MTGANPVDRGKPGSKYHLVIDASGIPLAVGLSAANTHDSLLLGQLVDAVPAVIGSRGRPGRPRKRPVKLHADKGYDFPSCRQALRRRADILTALLQLACALICVRKLRPLWTTS